MWQIIPQAAALSFCETATELCYYLKLLQENLTFSLLQGFLRCLLRQTFSVPALLTPFVCNFFPQEQKRSESHIISLSWTQDLFAVPELYAHGIDSPGDPPSVPT